MDNGPDRAEYFGPPSPEIDKAWKNLIGSGYLSFRIKYLDNSASNS
jgi:hypothetical protein